MRKTIYTLNIDDYSPQITALTYPLIQRYADKIQADLYTIRTRCWPGLPPVYEKLQIYELAHKRHDEWAYYIDSDALVHPDFFDPTDHVTKDTVIENGADMAGNRWRYDDYFRRDGRHIGCCNWFTIASEWCLDLWHPLDDMPVEQAFDNIFPIQSELSTVITREHLIDDYVLSRNVARYGLKFTTIGRMLHDMGDTGMYLWHQYTLTAEQKVEQMKQVLTGWGLYGS